MKPKKVAQSQDGEQPFQREFLALQEIIASMQRTSELNEVLEQISRAIVQVLGYDNSLIALLDRDKKVFKLAVAHAKLGQGLVARLEQMIGKRLIDFEIPVRRDYSEAARALLDGEVYLSHRLSDLLSPPLSRFLCFAMQTIAGVETMANIPLPGREGIIGNILVTTPRQEITEAELNTLRTLASQAGIAVERAWLRQDADREAAEKEKAEQKVREQAAKLRESKAFIESVFSAIADPIVVLNPDGIIIAVNRATTELLGRQEDEFTGRNYIDVLHRPEERDLRGKAHTEVITTGVPAIFERVWQTRNGEEIPVAIHDAPLRDDEGNIIGTIAAARDMRPMKSLIADLERGKAFIESVFCTIAEPIIVVNPDKVIIAVNKAVTELLGYGEEELIGHNYINVIIPPGRRHVSGKTPDEIMAKGVPLVFERVWQTRDGDEIPMELHVAPLRDDKGNIIGTIAAARDMRQVKGLIAELERSKAFIEGVFQAIADPILVINRDRVIIAVNKATTELLGYQEEELVGHRYMDVYHPPDRRHLSGKRHGEVVATGEPVIFESSWQAKDGEQIPVAIHASPLRDAEGRVIGLIAAARDMRQVKGLIAELEASKRELARSEARYRAIFDHAPDPIIVTDADNIVQLWNRRAAEVSGYKAEEVIGRSAELFVPPELYDEARWLAREVRQKGYIRGFETERVMRDGSRVPHELTIAALQDENGEFKGFTTIARDISERKRLEREKAEAQERLARAERLASIGQVGSSVAHELRQPLSVINNSVYFLRMQLPDAGEKVKKHLDILEREVAAAEKIISDLLDLARPDRLSLEPADLNAIIEQALSRAQLPPEVEVTTALKELPPMTADAAQLERVFLNLILNAAQAMPDGGRLVITSDSEDKAAVVRVQDSGHGIAAEDLDRVFEPLFTRKARGIGLGLAISKSIVQALQGTIEIQSQLGQGTTVTVKLPIR